MRKCATPGCDRPAKIASEPGFSFFCCVGCAEGFTLHSIQCEAMAAQRAALTSSNAVDSETQYLAGGKAN